MRELKPKHRITNKTKDAVAALAWASYRRGNVPWKGNNVSVDVFEYLSGHGVLLTRSYSPKQLNYIMRMLSESDLADIQIEQTGITHFAFKPDVVIQGHYPLFVTDENPVAQAESKATPTVNVLDLPVPALPVTRYRKDELDELLDKFFAVNPESYADYIDRLLPALKVVVDG
jgi:hypothetical protein